MANWWYIEYDKKIGPCEKDSFINIIQSKHLSGDTLVWTAGYEDWVKLSSISEFNEYFMEEELPPPLPNDIAPQPTQLPKKTLEEQIENDVTEKISKNYPNAGAWRRFFARIFDVYLLNIIIVSILSFTLSYNFRGFAEWISNGSKDMLFSISCIPLSLAMESLIYSIFKSTPGKFLLGLNVLNYNDKKINGADYFSRNAALYTSALALGLPLINLFTMYSQYRSLSSSGKSTYDKKLGFTVVRRNSGIVKTIVFALLFIGLLFGMMVLNKMSQQKQLYGSNELQRQTISNAQHQPALNPGFTWLNKATGKSATVDEGWNISEQTVSGITSFTFSSQTSDTAIVIDHEDINIGIKSYVSFLTGKKSKLINDDAGIYDKTQSGYPLWVGQGTLRNQLAYQYSMMITNVNGRYWRMLTVYTNPAEEYAKIAKLQNAISNTIPH